MNTHEAISNVAPRDGSASAAAGEHERWDINPARSRLTFVLRHVIVHQIPGRFHAWGGTLFLNRTAPWLSILSVWIDLNSVDTDSVERDAHIRSAEFLDVARLPRAEFTSRALEAKGDGLAVRGRLQLHGVTHDLDLEVAWASAGESRPPGAPHHETVARAPGFGRARWRRGRRDLPSAASRRPRRAGSTGGDPSRVLSVLKAKMGRHDVQMRALMSRVVLLDDDGVARAAGGLFDEPSLARPLVGDELNGLLPDRFFVLQDEIRQQARRLVIASNHHDRAAVADEFAAMSKTCITRHEVYLRGADIAPYAGSIP